jgi:hypothetical protein
MNDEKLPTNLERVFERLDDDCDALKPFFIEEISADLERRSVDTASTTEAIRKLLNQAKAMHQSQILADHPSIAERVGEAVEQIAVGIKRLLSEFRNESFVAAHLGNDVAPAETDVVRVIPLADCPGLRQRLPWLGGVLRVYQQERRPDQSTAKYVAFVETLNVEPNQQNGELKVVLAANGGKRSEVLLSFDYSSCEFPVRLPADESQLTLECYANNIA